MATVDFYFDLACPYSFLSSTKINEICNKYNTSVIWYPIMSNKQLPPPINYSKSTAKRDYYKKILFFYAKRTINNNKFYQTLLNYSNKDNASYENEMKFLLSIQDTNKRIKCAQILFDLIWIKNDQNINLQNIKNKLSINNSSNNNLQDVESSIKQFSLFATPSFIVNKKHLFYGFDRLSFVEQLLKEKEIVYPPYININKVNKVNKMNKLEFYFDFSSPWAYLGYCRLYELNGFIDEIVYKPILLGALFRDIGTANAPALKMSKEIRNYMNKDMDKWCRIAATKIKFTTHFPIRTVLPLRVFLINNQTIHCIYRGAWQWNINIGNEKCLCDLLNKFGFNGNELIKNAKSNKKIKKILRDNTEFAKQKGMFGVPSYVVNNNYNNFIWGQDKLELVKDLCCGWKPETTVFNAAKL